MKTEKKKKERNGMEEINLDFEKCSNLPRTIRVIPISFGDTFGDDFARYAIALHRDVLIRISRWIAEGRFGF